MVTIEAPTVGVLDCTLGGAALGWELGLKKKIGRCRAIEGLLGLYELPKKPSLINRPLLRTLLAVSPDTSLIPADPGSHRTYGSIKEACEFLVRIAKFPETHVSHATLGAMVRPIRQSH